ncbi:metalloprotease TldD [Beggiatoa leptomitoformis]|uniref:Metalloprotease TldD n=1 Tax=Beggiatoa leptomitoformis TaxID=288004 RepID=A0A2N9YFQ8_9GAMM|nr:metalloprotease TldD [Beggiatoa leptomitoformis]ALG68467.1 metalloprotease TldD [Beggiatoa leptomitoformis]AUI69199.1 metalloprotease TldD [Beggiatoa leptomitoformis]
MSTALSLATEQLLTPTALSLTDISQVLTDLLGYHIDYADLYFQSSHSEAWASEEGIVKEGSHSITQGVGIRAISGEKTGFAYSNDLTLSALSEAAKTARCIAQRGQSGQAGLWRKTVATPHYSAINPLNSLTAAEKVNLLNALNQAAHQEDPRVKQVILTLHGAYSTILVAASDGTLAADVRPLVRLNVNVVVEENGRREQGGAGGGGRFGYEYFNAGHGLNYVKEAVRRALVNLEAIEAPAGTMPVILSAGWPGVLLHEAIGHGLEGDFNRKGTSAFSGRIGQAVASPLCTIVDDGTLVDRRGSLTIDDEGTPSQCTTLIEKGILQGYMQDKHNAKLMGVVSTGNGRRESYTSLPLPRMTNTYMLAGEDDPADIIASVDKGLYAVHFGGGQVDITSGKFVFTASEAYLIEQGKITRPVKGATLIGNGADVLTQVSRVGNDLKLDSGVGVCGKDGQSIPVGVGQPTLRVDRLTVGGTKT